MVYVLSLLLQIDYMDSHTFAADLGRDQEEYSGDGPNPKNSCSDQKQQALRQQIIPSRVTVLCSTCAQPRWESEWNFSIEDGVAINNSKNPSSSSNRGDSMKEKAGKSQKMRKKMGRVIYYRQPRVLVSP